MIMISLQTWVPELLAHKVASRLSPGACQEIYWGGGRHFFGKGIIIGGFFSIFKLVLYLM